MEQLVRVMKAMSDPGRVAILKLLDGRELCACEIIRVLGLAQPTISRHMKVLADAGLVTGRKKGSWVHYRVAEAPASPYARAMLAQLSGWLEDDPEVARLRAGVESSAPCGTEARRLRGPLAAQGGRP
ncbi:MAG: winged helix-turn-helix transcriptional regulator [Desulfovibrio sp.]|nr:winged helix-turn-helix transcriptional regulator [Desulfovibrio sp.]